MSCKGGWFSRHHWDLWSEPQETPMIRVLTRGGVVVSEVEYTVSDQERKCLLCGLIQRRRVA